MKISSHFVKHHNHYEGFAYWLEHTLADHFQLRQLLQQKNQGTLNQYLKLTILLDEISKKKGKKVLLESLGFQI